MPKEEETRDVTSVALSHVGRTLYGKIGEYVPGDCIHSYRELAEEFFIINGITGDLKKSFLLTSFGTVVYEKLRALVHPKKPSECEIGFIWEVLEKFYSPKSHTLTERYYFLKAYQQEGETIPEFIVRVKNLSEKCKFGDFIPNDLSTTTSAELKNKALESALLDKIIMGISDLRIQQKLLERTDLTYEKCIDLTTTLEMSRRDQVKMGQAGYVNAIKGTHKSIYDQNKNKKHHRSRSQSQSSKLLEPRKLKSFVKPCPAENL